MSDLDNRSKKESNTLSLGVDPLHPNELLITGSAPAPKAGKLDIYCVVMPRSEGSADCLVRKKSSARR